MLPLPDIFSAISWNGEIAGSVDFTALPNQISRPYGGCEVVSRTVALARILWTICKQEICWTDAAFAELLENAQKDSGRNQFDETSENQRETQLNR
jgi:hypothetical protein